MAFIDPKEEVINIELTSYGKLLLSRGLFKPVYYSFHDEDIIYDLGYVSASEITSNAEVRIQENTPYLKPLYSFSSPTASISKDINQSSLVEELFNFNTDKVVKYDNSLGNSSISNLYVPSWKINNLSSNFISTSKTFTSKSINIPQLDCILTSSLFRTTGEIVDNDPELSEAVTYENSYRTSNDDVSLYITEEVLLKIEELNTDLELDHFDVEVYKINTDKNGVENYVPLKFIKQQNYIDQDGFLVDTTSFTETEIDETYVEHYFTISLDNEIENNKVCKYILKTTADQDQIFNDITVCDTPDVTVATNDLYSIVVDRAKGKNC
jgi:hypothetical protein